LLERKYVRGISKIASRTWYIKYSDEKDLRNKNVFNGLLNAVNEDATFAYSNRRA